MARVRSFGPSTQNVKVHPTEVDCEYKTIFDDTGQPYLHLSTFGSDDREAERKSSQSIQLDAVRCRELLAILEKAFPELPDCHDPTDTANAGVAGPSTSAPETGTATDTKPESINMPGIAEPIHNVPTPEMLASGIGQESSKILTTALIETAATVIADELKMNVQSRQWNAVLIRTTEILNGSTERS
ncbi:hypothetical protein [Dactylosporangium sp. NPDC000521]|uniref:hypothetical protein n=1 Tax=Dactylosporangium sp. NPDC000521 TaxID=3363975 RepID=UPI0036A22A5E